MIRSTLHHLGIVVSDLERSISFYREAFGLVPVDRAVFSGEELSEVVGVPNATLEYVFMSGDNVLVELIEYKSPRGRPFDRANNDTGTGHLCFVVDDIEAVYARVLGLGGTASSTVQTAPDIAPFNGLRYAYCRDPDGITIELFQPGDGPLSLPRLLMAGRRLAETGA